MGLITNLLLAVIHLAFAVMDIITIIILVDAIYSRHGYQWLEPMAKAIKPALDAILNWLDSLIFNALDTHYGRRALLIMLLIAMIIIRLVIAGIF